MTLFDPSHPALAPSEPRCCICIIDFRFSDDIAPMYDPDLDALGADIGGLCHVKCGEQMGWVR